MFTMLTYEEGFEQKAGSEGERRIKLICVITSARAVVPSFEIADSDHSLRYDEFHEVLSLRIPSLLRMDVTTRRPP